MKIFKKAIVGSLVALTLFIGTGLPLVGSAQTPNTGGSGGSSEVANPAPGQSAAVTGEDPTEEVTDKKTLAKYAKAAAQGTVLLTLFSDLLNYVARIDPFENTLTQQGVGAAIISANRFILNLANLAFILLLLVIALATIFDIETYKAQKLLPKLIIAILLANFGLFFVRAIADFSQILAQGLLTEEGLAQPLIKATGIVELYTESIKEKAVGLIPGINIAVIFFELVNPLNWFMVAFALTALILALRIAGLWVLAIFAPIGTVLGVLPSTAPLAKTYWRKVIAYSFSGPAMIFFVRLAVIVYTAAMPTDDLNRNWWEKITDLFNSVVYGPLYKNLIPALLAALIIFIGIAFVRKMGVEVANFAIGAFEKGFKGLMTAGKVAAIAGATVATGGAAGGGFAAFLASKGFSEGAQKSIGLLGQGLSKGLKGSGNKTLAAIGGAIDAPTKKAYEEQLQPHFVNPYKNAGDNQRVRSIMDKMVKDNPELREIADTDPYQIFDRARQEQDAQKRAAYAMLLAESGKLGDSMSFKKDEKGNDTPEVDRFDIRLLSVAPKYEKMVRAEASNKDIRMHAELQPIMDPGEYQKKLEKLVRANVMDYQGGQALGDPRVMTAIQKVKADDIERLSNRWSIKQRRAAAIGLSKGADDAGARQDIDAWSRMKRRAINLGADPFEVLRPAKIEALRRQNVPDPIISTLRQAANALQKAAATSPEAYVNQKTNVAVKMAQSITDPEKVSKIITSPKIVPSTKYALREAARDDAKLPFDRRQFANAGVRDAFLANIKFSKDAPTGATK